MGYECHLFANMITSRALTALSSALLLGSSACAGDTGEISTADDVGVVRAAVEDGILLTGDDASDYTGMVRIWAHNSQFDEFRQFCGGVLITNKLVATSRHCLETSQEAIDYGWPDTRSSTAELIVSSNLLNYDADGVGEPAYAPDGRDLAVFKLSRAIPVKTRGEFMREGFVRALGGTPDAGALLTTIGYGETARGVTSTICKYVSKESGLTIRGCPTDPLDLNLGVGAYVSNAPKEILNSGVSSIPGDSGGATVLGVGEADLADLPLVGINSMANRCIDTPTGKACGAVSARTDDLKTWFGALGNF
jgi:hypothetical protein